MNGRVNNAGNTQVTSLADAGPRKGASVAKTVPWNAISQLDRLAVPIVLGGVIGLAVNISFGHMSVGLIISMHVVGFQFVSVMVIPSVIKMSIYGVSIISSMIPAQCIIVDDMIKENIRPPVIGMRLAVEQAIAEGRG